MGHWFVDITDKPFPCIQATGQGAAHFALFDEPASPMSQDKPPYQVSSMAEIEALPWNGMNVVSTFSGCGGSCLGYRMAGFSVLWANEFNASARDSYRANHGSILDGRDIREVKPEEILQATGLKAGELDIFDGSPPCTSFSTAGKRDKGWGKVKQSSETGKPEDDLFFEYARILKGLQPKVFIAENVSGLIKGTAKGYFKIIFRELEECGYDVSARPLDAQWLGVPQQRQRLIFMGVRSDLGKAPVYPSPLPYNYTVREAVPWLMSAVHDTSGLFGSGPFLDRPSPMITIGVNSINSRHFQVTGPEPESDISRFAIGREWDKIKPGETSNKYFNLAKAHPDKPCPTVTMTASIRGAAGVVHPTEKRKFSIAELRRICGFPDDFVLCGSYSEQSARLGNCVPPVMMAKIAEVVRDKILKE